MPALLPSSPLLDSQPALAQRDILNGQADDAATPRGVSIKRDDMNSLDIVFVPTAIVSYIDQLRRSASNVKEEVPKLFKRAIFYGNSRYGSGPGKGLRPDSNAKHKIRPTKRSQLSESGNSVIPATIIDTTVVSANAPRSTVEDITKSATMMIKRISRVLQGDQYEEVGTLVKRNRLPEGEETVVVVEFSSDPVFNYHLLGRSTRGKGSLASFLKKRWIYGAYATRYNTQKHNPPPPPPRSDPPPSSTCLVNCRNRSISNHAR
jgi:hypothetical protein